MEDSVNETDLSRRDFLRRSVAGLSLAALPAWYAQEAVAAEAERAAVRPARVGANDRINLACIGPGGSRGGFRQGLGDTHAIKGQGGVQVVAVCDVDRQHREEAARSFGSDCAQFCGLPRAAGAQRHRRRRHRHAGPLAHADRASPPCRRARTSTARSRSPSPSRRASTLVKAAATDRSRLPGRQPAALRRAVPPGLRAGAQRPHRQGEARRGAAAERLAGRAVPVQPVPDGFDWDFGWARRPTRLHQGADAWHLPLLVRVLRRHDDRLGRPPQRHRPVGPRDGRLGADPGRVDR